MDKINTANPTDRKPLYHSPKLLKRTSETSATGKKNISYPAFTALAHASLQGCLRGVIEGGTEFLAKGVNYVQATKQTESMRDASKLRFHIGKAILKDPHRWDGAVYAGIGKGSQTVVKMSSIYTLQVSLQRTSTYQGVREFSPALADLATGWTAASLAAPLEAGGKAIFDHWRLLAIAGKQDTKNTFSSSTPNRNKLIRTYCRTTTVAWIFNVILISGTEGNKILTKKWKETYNAKPPKWISNFAIPFVTAFTAAIASNFPTAQITGDYIPQERLGIPDKFLGQQKKPLVGIESIFGRACIDRALRMSPGIISIMLIDRHLPEISHRLTEIYSR